jgi:hypothetical protein
MACARVSNKLFYLGGAFPAARLNDFWVFDAGIFYIVICHQNVTDTKSLYILFFFGFF